jgi:hypothetical protein
MLHFPRIFLFEVTRTYGVGAVTQMKSLAVSLPGKSVRSHPRNPGNWTGKRMAGMLLGSNFFKLCYTQFTVFFKVGRMEIG